MVQVEAHRIFTLENERLDRVFIWAANEALQALDCRMRQHRISL
jgi:hypothetical protein